MMNPIEVITLIYPVRTWR